MLKHPFNNLGARERLLSDYKKYGQIVVGLDFDNTIYNHVGSQDEVNEVLQLILRCQALGFPICLFTAEPSSQKLSEKYNYLKDLGINLTYINQSPLMKGTQKPFFSVLLDDRAGLESAYDALLYVVNYAEDQSHQS